MLTVGMMRPGDKLASYRILSEALHKLTGPWSLNIAGDGPARAEVEALMAPFGAQVRFLGQLDRDALQRLYCASSMLLWPGVNEAYGMVYLEAQAVGLPVLAQDRPGVRDVLAPSLYPSVEGGAAEFAEHVQRFLDNADLRLAAGNRARSYVSGRHLMPSATERFWETVRPLLEVPE